MLLLILAAPTLHAPPLLPRPAQARATVRIQRAATASPEQWNQAAPATRKQVLRRDDRGHWLLLKIVDFE